MPKVSIQRLGKSTRRSELAMYSLTNEFSLQLPFLNHPASVRERDSPHHQGRLDED